MQRLTGDGQSFPNLTGWQFHKPNNCLFVCFICVQRLFKSYSTKKTEFQKHSARITFCEWLAWTERSTCVHVPQTVQRQCLFLQHPGYGLGSKSNTSHCWHGQIQKGLECKPSCHVSPASKGRKHFLSFGESWGRHTAHELNFGKICINEVFLAWNPVSKSCELGFMFSTNK